MVIAIAIAVNVGIVALVVYLGRLPPFGVDGTNARMKRVLRATESEFRKGG